MSLGFKRDPLANPEALISRVYSYVAYRLGDGPEAEDVTSEVIERALRYRSSYDRSKGEPLGWLLGIARRCTSAALAARTAEQPVGEIVDASGEDSVEEDSVRRVTLAAAIAQLSAQDQELLALRFGADLTAAQIANVLEVQTNAVQVRLHRMLGRLRSILEEEHPKSDAAVRKHLPSPDGISL